MISKLEMGRVTDQAVFLDTPVSSRTWTVVSRGTNHAALGGGLAKEDLPPFHITGTLHKISQGLITEIERSHGSKEGRENERE